MCIKLIHRFFGPYSSPPRPCSLFCFLLFDRYSPEKCHMFTGFIRPRFNQFIQIQSSNSGSNFSSPKENSSHNIHAENTCQKSNSSKDKTKCNLKSLIKQAKKKLKIASAAQTHTRTLILFYLGMCYSYRARGVWAFLMQLNDFGFFFAW